MADKHTVQDGKSSPERFIPPLSSPESVQFRESTEKENAARVLALKRFASLAAADNPEWRKILGDETTFRWLLAFIEKQPGGFERYISGDFGDLAKAIRREQVGLLEQMRSYRERASTFTDGQLSEVSVGLDAIEALEAFAQKAGTTPLSDLKIDGKEALPSAHHGDVVRALSAVKTELERSRDDEEVARTRAVAVDMIRAILLAENTKHTDALLTELHALVGSDSGKLSEVFNTLTSSGAPVSVDHEKVVELISLVKKALHIVSIDSLESEIQRLKVALSETELQRRRLLAPINAPRRSYNWSLGGSDAAVIIGYAETETHIDFDILAKEWKSLTNSDLNIDKAKDAAGFAGSLPSVNPIPKDWSDKKDVKGKTADGGREKLRRFLETQLASNPAGVSISAMNARVTEYQTMREFFRDALERSTDRNTGVVNPATLHGLLYSACGLPLSDGSLRQELRLEQNGTLPRDWKDEREHQVICFLLKKHKEIYEKEAKGNFEIRLKALDSLSVDTVYDLVPHTPIPPSTVLTEARAIGITLPLAAGSSDLDRLITIPSAARALSILGADALKGQFSGATDAAVANSIDEILKTERKRHIEDILASQDAAAADTGDKRTAIIPGIARSLRLLLLKEDTGIDFPHVTWDDHIRDYARDGKAIGLHGFDQWWTYVKGLRKNVWSPENADVHLALLDQRDALQDALDAVESLARLNKESDDDIQETIDELETMVQEEVRAEKEGTKPVNTVSEHLREWRVLLRLADVTLQRLHRETVYDRCTDPEIRRQAFLIAVRSGVEEANTFLKGPEAYRFQHADEHLNDMLRAHGDRLQGVDESIGRDLLAPLRKHGIVMRPTALNILAMSYDGGSRLSEGPAAVQNWLSSPIDAAPALRAILTADPARALAVPGESLSQVVTPASVDDLIQAFVTGEDTSTITAEDALRCVTSLQLHLLRQADQRRLVQFQLQHGEGVGFDPKAVLRTAVSTVRDMLQSGDREKQLLGGILAGTAVYALYKMWTSSATQGKLALLGIPAFFGLDVALQHATGRGLISRLNMQYLSPEQRSSVLVDFIRAPSGDPEKDKADPFYTSKNYAFLDTSGLGHATMRALSKVPLSTLIAWRDKVQSGGETSYEDPIIASLPLGEVQTAMGVYHAETSTRAERKELAYKYCYRAFEAFCIRTARRNAVADASQDLTTQANRGARVLQQKYVDNPPTIPALVDADLANGFRDSLQQFTNGKPIDIASALVFEGYMGEGNDPSANLTHTEWAIAKAGAGAGMMGRVVGKGVTHAEIIYEHAKEKVPKWAEYGKKQLLDTYGDFKEWYRMTKDKLGDELSEDFYTVWQMLRSAATEAKAVLLLTDDGVAWSFDMAADGTNRYISTMLNLWYTVRGLGIVTGPVIEGIEAQILRIAGKPPEQLAFDELADIEIMKSSLVAMVERSGIADAAKSDSFVTTCMTTMKIDASVSPEERVIKHELLKRSIYTYLLSNRYEQAQNNQSNPLFSLDRLSPVATLPDPAKIDGTSGKLDLTNQTAVVQRIYPYIFDNYLADADKPLHHNLMQFLGRESSIPGGTMRNAAKGGSAVGTALDAVTGWAFYDDAQDYIKGIAWYEKQFLTDEAKNALTPDQYKQYEAYVRTALLNALVEQTLTRTDASSVPLQLSIADAKDFRTTIIRARGLSPALKRVRAHTSLLQPFLPSAKAVLPPADQKNLQTPAFQRLMLGGLSAQQAPKHGGGISALSAAATSATPGVAARIAPFLPSVVGGMLPVPPTPPASALPQNYIPAPNAAPQSVLEPVERSKILALDLSQDSARKRALQALPQMGPDTQKLRDKFDTWFKGNGLLFKQNGSQLTPDQLIDAVQGVSKNVQTTAEDAYFAKIMQSSNKVQLSDVLTIQNATNVIADPESKLRVERLMDRAILKVVETHIAPAMTDAASAQAILSDAEALNGFSQSRNAAVQHGAFLGIEGVYLLTTSPPSEAGLKVFAALHGGLPLDMPSGLLNRTYIDRVKAASTITTSVMKSLADTIDTHIKK